MWRWLTFNLQNIIKELANQKCTPCNEEEDPLKEGEIEEFLEKVDGWKEIDQHHLKRTYDFNNFKQGLDFVNKIGELAEKEGHHPNLKLSWGKVEVKLWTHNINGLSENDFIMAAKINNLYFQ